MPGRGGRSKACENCYRRRIKCDETRPKCLKCVKAKLECGGYKPFTILAYDGGGERWSATYIDQKNADSARGSMADQSFPDSSTEPSTVSNTTDMALAFQLVPSADDVFVNYTLSNLLSAGSQYKLVTGVHRDLSDQTFLALSTFFFGNEHKEQEVVQHGLHRYGKVLQTLNVALGDAMVRRTYDVLESVILATMLEFLMSDRPDGWISHSVGIEQLFKCKGPHSFKPYAERAILERSRTSIIFASLALRKPTILSKPKWKTVPWESALGDKSLFEYLVDIMADCPQLLVVQDKMHAARGLAIAKTHACDLCIQVSTLRQQLREWKQLWDTAEPDCRHEASDKLNMSGDTQSTTNTEEYRPAKFVYRSLYHANAMTLYDATTILLERVLQSTIDADAIEPQLAATEPESADAAVVDIVRSADYCIDNARGGLGSFYILFPIRMAWAWANDHRDDVLRTLVESILHRIQLGAAGHWAVAGYLLSIANGPDSSLQRIGTCEAVDIGQQISS